MEIDHKFDEISARASVLLGQKSPVYLQTLLALQVWIYLHDTRSGRCMHNSGRLIRLNSLLWDNE